MNKMIFERFRNATEVVYGKSVTAWAIVDFAATYFNNKENATMLTINSAISCAPKLFFKLMSEEVSRLESKKAPQSKTECSQYIHCAMEYAAEETVKTIEDFYSTSK